jgi:hypothetical protein
MKIRARITPTMAPDQWPAVLYVHDLAVITNRAPRTIENRCSAGTMDPPPATNQQGDPLKPLRWDRAVVRRWAFGVPEKRSAA